LAAPLSHPPSAAEIQQVTPLVEVWRANAQAPQVPARRGRHLEQAFIAGAEPVMLRLQFHPLAAGKYVLVRAGKGTILEVPNEILRIQPTGECIVALRLEESTPRGHVTFYCEGLTTTLSLARATPEFVAARETTVGGGAR
jgi:hypothetical protein